MNIVVVTEAALLIARRASTWTVDEHLGGRSPDCVAVDSLDPTRVYCGAADAGLFRSRDSGRNWEPVGPGIKHDAVRAVAVSQAQRAERYGIVYAGTEPSAVFRSGTGGDAGWAYAGFTFTFLAAAWSLYNSGDGIKAVIPLVFLAPLLASDRLRERSA